MKVPGVTNTHTTRVYIFFSFIKQKNFKNPLLMNHWPEYLDIWHGLFLGQGDSSFFQGSQMSLIQTQLQLL